MALLAVDDVVNARLVKAASFCNRTGHVLSNDTLIYYVTYFFQ